MVYLAFSEQYKKKTRDNAIAKNKKNMYERMKMRTMKERKKVFGYCHVANFFLNA